MSVSFSHEEFKKTVLQMSTDIVWKNKSEAVSNSIAEDSYIGEIFDTAQRGLLTFGIVRSFPRAVLRNVSLSPDLIEMYASDKTTIPEDMRDIVVQEYQRALISTNPRTGYYEYYDKLNGKYVVVYEESNNYYRMLMGLPDIGDSNFVYNTDSRWDTTTPIHLMSLIDRLSMESFGVIDTLLMENPTKKYLKYVGVKNIPYGKSRIADRFDILYLYPTGSDELQKTFISEYNKAKYMVNYVYYNKSLKGTNAMYENFLAMMILFMTIQSLMSKYLLVDISRDFYDVESLKIIYDSYSVPFYAEIPIQYHRKIVKNINKLMSNKGSSSVFLDLFKIFDIGQIDIFPRYLVKSHKIDDNGRPIFVLLRDEDGNIIYDNNGDPILDNSVYEIAFGSAGIYDDPSLALSDKSNRIDYEDVINGDPYWYDDESILEMIKEENFNFTESKYLNVRTILNLTTIMYEYAYLFRMIADNFEDTQKMEVTWNAVAINTDIFSMFMYIATLYCEYYTYSPTLSDKLHDLAITIGYNYNDMVDIYNNVILTDNILANNNRLKEAILEMSISDIDSVNQNIDDINTVKDIIGNGMADAKTIDEFDSYKNLYNLLLISEDVKAAYANPITGEIFEDYGSIVEYYSPKLFARYIQLIDSIPPDEEVRLNVRIKDEIDLAVAQLETSLDNIKYLSLAIGVSSTSLLDSLYKLVAFFKSAKAELSGYGISYILSTRNDNFFKLLDIYSRHGESFRIDDYILFYDTLRAYGEIVKHHRSYITFKDRLMSQHEVFLLEDKHIFDDLLYAAINMLVEYHDMSFELVDILGEIICTGRLPNEYIKIIERYLIRDIHYVFDTHIFTDKDHISSEYTYFIQSKMYFIDFLEKYIIEEVRLRDDNFTMVESFIDMTKSILMDIMMMRDIISEYPADIFIYDIQDLIDSLKEDGGIYYYQEKINLIKKETIRSIINWKEKEYHVIIDKMMQGEHTIDISDDEYFIDILKDIILHDIKLKSDNLTQVETFIDITRSIFMDKMTMEEYIYSIPEDINIHDILAILEIYKFTNIISYLEDRYDIISKETVKMLLSYSSRDNSVLIEKLSETPTNVFYNEKFPFSDKIMYHLEDDYLISKDKALFIDKFIDNNIIRWAESHLIHESILALPEAMRGDDLLTMIESFSDNDNTIKLKDYIDLIKKETIISIVNMSMNDHSIIIDKFIDSVQNTYVSSNILYIDLLEKLTLGDINIGNDNNNISDWLLDITKQLWKDKITIREFFEFIPDNISIEDIVKQVELFKEIDTIYTKYEKSNIIRKELTKILASIRHKDSNMVLDILAEGIRSFYSSDRTDLKEYLLNIVENILNLSQEDISMVEVFIDNTLVIWQDIINIKENLIAKPEDRHIFDTSKITKDVIHKILSNTRISNDELHIAETLSILISEFFNEDISLTEFISEFPETVYSEDIIENEDILYSKNIVSFIYDTSDMIKKEILKYSSKYYIIDDNSIIDNLAEGLRLVYATDNITYKELLYTYLDSKMSIQRDFYPMLDQFIDNSISLYKDNMSLTEFILAIPEDSHIVDISEFEDVYIEKTTIYIEELRSIITDKLIKAMTVFSINDENIIIDKFISETRKIYPRDSVEYVDMLISLLSNSVLLHKDNSIMLDNLTELTGSLWNDRISIMEYFSIIRSNINIRDINTLIESLYINNSDYYYEDIGKLIKADLLIGFTTGHISEKVLFNETLLINLLDAIYTEDNSLYIEFIQSIISTNNVASEDIRILDILIESFIPLWRDKVSPVDIIREIPNIIKLVESIITSDNLISYGTIVSSEDSVNLEDRKISEQASSSIDSKMSVHDTHSIGHSQISVNGGMLLADQIDKIINNSFNKKGKMVFNETFWEA